MLVKINQRLKDIYSVILKQKVVFKTYSRVWVSLVILILLTATGWCVYLHYAKGMIWADWTGFGSYTGTLLQDQRSKTLWDWMELLIIPIVLTVGGFFFNWAEKRNDQSVAKQKFEDEQKNSQDQQQETALKNYLDRLTVLLLDKGLANAQNDTAKDHLSVKNSCIIARTLSLTTLKKLNPERKQSLLLFLYEAKLISGNDPTIDLTGANLSEVNLSGKVLKEINLTGVCLNGTNFESANLTKGSFTGAEMFGAKLNYATLTGAYLQKVQFNKAALFRDLHLNNADLSQTKLERVTLVDSELKGANLQNTKMKRATIINVYLNEAILTETDLTQANIRESHMEKATMNWVVLNGATLFNVILSEANIEDAQLNNTTFVECNLSYVKLNRSKMQNVDLKRANLMGARLVGADLTGAQLQGSNLSYADLTAAGLAGANLTGADLNGTIMPDGQVCYENSKG
ncbi:MAG: pentapeptide repeat-containing protein [Chloroflexi bacterium]|nr:pentapeptide repeat-containing protein [Chloroflexota bacterium]